MIRVKVLIRIGNQSTESTEELEEEKEEVIVECVCYDKSSWKMVLEV